MSLSSPKVFVHLAECSIIKPPPIHLLWGGQHGHCLSSVCTDQQLPLIAAVLHYL